MIQVPMTFKQIGFTGDYAQLKSMGFEFQKLYAGNYMQWHHEESDVRIWKKGADVTISQISGMEGQLLQMMLDDTVFPIKHSNIIGYYLEMYVNCVTNILTLDHRGHEAEVMLGCIDRSWQSLIMNRDTILMLQKLGKLGWIHVKDVEGVHYIDEKWLEVA